MESFGDFLTKWQPFFSAVSGVAATLAGLLFVSLSINRERITARDNLMLLRLARRSFGDLLYTLFLSLMFLFPSSKAHILAFPLFIVSGFRAFGIIAQLCGRGRNSSIEPTRWLAIRERAFQVATTVGTVGAACEIYAGNLGCMYFLVPVVALLLFNASMNAWSLLVLESTPDTSTASKY